MLLRQVGRKEIFGLERTFWVAVFATPVRKVWLEKWSAGKPERSKMDFRCFGETNSEWWSVWNCLRRVCRRGV